MTVESYSSPVVRLRDLRHDYGRTRALDGLSLDIPSGCMVGLVGPDGVGKSTLLALIAGAKILQDGGVEVLGGDIAQKSWRNEICPRIAYMPQGLGKNLYPDLTVEENISFFSRLYGQSAAEGAARVAGLMRDIGLRPFAKRLCSQLSGGMKQKLGLCCALIHDPDLLILDEPTTGVDPLSRRQFWELVDAMRVTARGAAGEGPAMSVIVATAYMEEAERFDFLIVMNDGKILATGAPREIMATTSTQTIEDAFVALLPEGGARPKLSIPPRKDDGGPPVISARGLTKKFGDFTAVDHVDLDIARGEIFGFLGSNGCGKTTTMKMLTGLTEASRGEALLFGQSVQAGGIQARRRVGYMSQGFSLYSELTVRQNLDLHAKLFGLAPQAGRERIAELMARFGLDGHSDALAADLPLGLRQRLSLAVALVHDPDLLILDEPTSGVDPLARDDFWRLLIDLSRDQGVTIFMSTHFMNEAARCDRISLMDSGKVLATGTPAQIVAAQGAKNLEDAFVSLLEKAGAARPPPVARIAAPRTPPKNPAFSLRRMMAYTIREILELSRDPIRLSYAVLGPALLLLLLGFGITTDVDSLTFAALDRDNSFHSRAYLSEVRGSSYFLEQPEIASASDLIDRMKGGKVSATIEIPPGFGRDIKKGEPTEVSVWIDGAMPFRAETIHGYLSAAHQQFISDPAIRGMKPASPTPANIETRFRYNQSFDSIYAMVPASIALQLALMPAILMALAIVREKELGSITNLYVTPVTRLEFLAGKQLPYIALAFADFFVMFLMALYIFGVPLKGGFSALALGALVYVAATTGYGMVISAFTKTQIAALFGATILTILPATMFSGMSTPAASITGFGRIMGQVFPMTYFLPICVGAFTKGLHFADLAGHLAKLALFFPALVGLSLLLLRKQEK
ncbi:ribosome-associated ATPase/putative transporter RbbA [Rhodoblastus acidophilus]|uniref:Ribosome-associated ATPase/putative transporter RbbA n=1 Tax=Rhodoblastus acidophilus TaxID=1074 RepID=A0A6N8DJ50_RHOAC|nr:ribosome-associated ATPase/putative transporter RbbA [Rhodoblastus acidophilus]MCW2272592.1 ribosome-dependent ATPase [Rhodoblastus acidophilus]MTV29505.1 ribosome-associated ATPase/putative transporter RbbA [Rhodoblastus acidophilus]